MAKSNTTENWRPVVGYEGFYEVSDLGRVRSIDRIVRVNIGGGITRKRHYKGQILKPALNKGRPFVGLSRNQQRKNGMVHRLVLEAFVGPCPDNMECRHFPDRYPLNNKLTNLSWGTHEENMADKLVHGTMMRGEDHTMSQLTAQKVRKIFDLRDKGMIQREIGEIFGICHQQISRILRHERWQHIKCQANKNKYQQRERRCAFRNCTNVFAVPTDRQHKIFCNKRCRNAENMQRFRERLANQPDTAQPNP